MRSVSLEPVCILRRRLVEIQSVNPGFTGRPRSFDGRLSRGTGVNESRTFALRIDSLEVDYEFGRIVLGVGEHLSAVECNDMIRDDLHGLGGEVGVVDAKVSVEPIDFVGYEFTGDETLDRKIVRWLVMMLGA